MTVILDCYKEMCQPACKTPSHLTWGKLAPCLGIHLCESFSLSVWNGDIFHRDNAAIKKINTKIQPRLWAQSPLTISRSGIQLCISDVKLAPRAAVSLASTVQWHCSRPPVQDDHHSYHTCPICLFSVLHPDFPLPLPNQDFTYSAQGLWTALHCAA